ncbi:hypothetical protein ACFW3F_21560, partial [Gordonia sp. NPDC058843]
MLRGRGLLVITRMGWSIVDSVIAKAIMLWCRRRQFWSCAGSRLGHRSHPAIDIVARRDANGVFGCAMFGWKRVAAGYFGSGVRDGRGCSVAVVDGFLVELAGSGVGLLGGSQFACERGNVGGAGGQFVPSMFGDADVPTGLFVGGGEVLVLTLGRGDRLDKALVVLVVLGACFASAPGRRQSRHGGARLCDAGCGGSESASGGAGCGDAVDGVGEFGVVGPHPQRPLGRWSAGPQIVDGEGVAAGEGAQVRGELIVAHDAERVLV